MRTKTLLMAGAALALSLATSQAQVYSANIVGYVNVVLPGNGAYSLIATPLDDGNGNYLTNILNSALPGGNATVRSTMFYLSGGSPVTINKLAAGWSGSPSLPPGTGYYIRNGAPGAGAPDLTNTFVGTVIPNVGNSVTNDIPVGYSLQGSVIPYAGNIAILGTPGGDANLNYGDMISVGTGAGVSKIGYLNGQSLTTVNKTFSTGNWTATIPISVGQGFWLINAGPDTNVVQTLAP